MGNDWGEVVVTGLVGLLAGFVIGAAVVRNQSNRDDTAEEIMQSENTPRIIRTWRRSRKNDLFVQNPENPKTFISLGSYLDSKYGTDNPYDRQMEEARIKKAARW